MRKYLHTLFLIVVTSQILPAQQSRFGMKSGVAISNISQQETEIGPVNINWRNKTSYQTGIFYNHRLKNSLLSFQIELDYKKIGTEFSLIDVDLGVDPSIKTEYEFEHLGLSILPRIDLFPNKKLNPNFMIGGIVELNTSSSLTFTSDLPDTLRPLKNVFFGGDLNNRTNNFLFGYLMAGGIEIATEPVIVTLECRYTSLFTAVFNDSVEELPFNGQTYILKIMEDSRHNYFSFLVGFNFYFD